MKIILLLIVAFVVTSCGIPLTVGMEGQHGTYTYSSKGGLGISIRATK